MFLTAGVGFFLLHFLFHFVGGELLCLLHHLLTFLAIPVITLLVLILAICWLKAESDTLRGNRRQWTLTLTLILLAALGTRFCDSTYCHRLPATHLQRSFDRAVWLRGISGLGAKATERQNMLGDLIRNVVVDSTRDEVLEALGEPDATSGANGGNGDRKFFYYVGPTQDSFGIPDSDVFVVSFKENGDVDNWYTERE